MASFTVIVVLPEIVVCAVAPCEAVIFAVPTATAVTRPVLSTVAVVAVSDAQSTSAVMSCWAPSSKVPVATNCSFVPWAMEGAAGVTAIDTSSPSLTVNVALPTIAPLVAEIDADPVPTARREPHRPRGVRDGGHRRLVGLPGRRPRQVLESSRP